MKTLKIGIISFAHMHAYSYANEVKKLDGVELIGIADENEERGKVAARRFATNYYSNYIDLLKEDIDAVIVTSENVNHREHVIAAAKAGKHVLCEKPLATTIEDAQAMIDCCRENGVILQTAFPVRFNTSVIHAKKLIDEGRLGKILAIKGTNRGTNPGGWFVDPSKSGGGAVMDHTVHLVDLMRWFMGAEVREVFAEIGQLISDAPIDDCGILTIEFDNGVFATIDCSWSRNKTYPTWGDVTLEIVGTEGTVTIDAFAQKIDVYSNENGVKWDFWGDNMDEGLIADFVQTVREGRSPFITGEDGLKAVEVAIAAYKSYEKKEPVRIR
ncbi:Gfo/Idh/MocA family oxidoreductase [Geobacillus sp. MR]|uniref:Gfo/Idh/MocA family protein n=1 Tax=Geobacillus sp. MR TaxID=2508875 RepID=UPI00148C423B|nr:Gfo/Idh/MocA family oxidoreductase [Geobacillus sp. MR]NNU88078.1 Gfo/Idh/MocA family oxidoreductase [Geobacillus sp. MR]